VKRTVVDLHLLMVCLVDGNGQSWPQHVDTTWDRGIGVQRVCGVCTTHGLRVQFRAVLVCFQCRSVRVSGASVSVPWQQQGAHRV
jgi:hypothetical protein